MYVQVCSAQFLRKFAKHFAQAHQLSVVWEVLPLGPSAYGLHRNAEHLSGGVVGQFPLRKLQAEPLIEGRMEGHQGVDITTRRPPLPR